MITVKSQMEQKRSSVAGLDRKLHIVTIYFAALDLWLLVLGRARTPTKIGAGLFQDEKCGVMLRLSVR